MANQAIRQEINILDTTVTGTGTTTANQIVSLSTTQYSGSPTYYFEAVYNGAASNTGTIALRDIAAATNVASLSGATSSTFIISRVQFTPTAGGRSYTVQIVGDGVRTQSLKCARIIILQSEPSITGTETQIEIGNQTAALSNTTVADITTPKFWKYNSANWDGSISFSAEVVYKTSAANTCTITLCRTSDNTANVTVVNAVSNTSYTRARVTFTPVNGETYKIRALCSSTKSSYTIACGKIVVAQTSSAKSEPQYMLLNTADAGTGAQTMLTTYNSSEWNAGNGTITITHLIDSDNASNSGKIVTSAGADTGSSSAVTGNVQPESSSFSLIDATNYDVNVTNSTGTVAASRLKFVYAFVARRIFVTGG